MAGGATGRDEATGSPITLTRPFGDEESRPGERKIALFVPTLRGGGAERVMVNLANAFTEQGLATDLVLVRNEGLYFDLLSTDVRVVSLGAPRILASLPGLVRYLRRERPEAMLSTLTYTNVVAIWAKQISGVDVRVAVREANAIGRVREHASSLKDWLVPWFARRVYPGADLAVGVSKGVADELVTVAGLDEDIVRVIYNPVVTDELLEKAEEPVEHRWLRGNDVPVILGAGRLTAQKDFATLIEAFARVRGSQAARLVILGEGEERMPLLERASELGVREDVDLPGFVENPFSYMYRSNVFVLSSRYEGLPGALIQALATGCSVISTDCPYGPEEILEGGRWGELVPVGDIEALSRAILNVLGDAPDTDALRTRGNEFNVKRGGERYLHALGFS